MVAIYSNVIGTMIRESTVTRRASQTGCLLSQLTSAAKDSQKLKVLLSTAQIVYSPMFLREVCLTLCADVRTDMHFPTDVRACCAQSTMLQNFKTTQSSSIMKSARRGSSKDIFCAYAVDATGPPGQGGARTVAAASTSSNPEPSLVCNVQPEQVRACMVYSHAQPVETACGCVLSLCGPLRLHIGFGRKGGRASRMIWSELDLTAAW
jgi:hypothetical protein